MTSINITTRDTRVVTKPFDSCFRLLNAHLRVQGHFNAISRPLLPLLVLPLQIVEPCRLDIGLQLLQSRGAAEKIPFPFLFSRRNVFSSVEKETFNGWKKKIFHGFCRKTNGNEY